MTLKISRLIERLKRLGLLHSGRYFAVLEVHKTGWPHWHVIVDAPDIPHEVITREWAKLGGGHVWISRGPNGRSFKNAKHAAHYALKYLRKEPAKGWPAWILDGARKIRRYRTSQNFFNNGEKRCSPAVEEVADSLINPPKKFYVKRSHRIRISACGSKTVVMGVIYERRRRGDVIERRERRKFLGQIDAPRSEVLRGMGCNPDHQGRFEAPMILLRDGPPATIWERLPWTGSQFDVDVHAERERRRQLDELRAALPC